jgi:shikimate kinase
VSSEPVRHLVLIGLMGAGKSTVGEGCAARLQRPFVDTDDLVLALTGKSIGEIFRDDGEEQFREVERRAVADACASPAPLVIACGGGAVLDPSNRRLLRGSGFVVWLRATASELATRVQGQQRERPLLPSAGEEAELERLSEVREPAYEATAHVSVDTGGRSVDEVVDTVLQELDRCAA